MFRWENDAATIFLLLCFCSRGTCSWNLTDHRVGLELESDQRVDSLNNRKQTAALEAEISERHPENGFVHNAIASTCNSFDSKLTN